MNESEARRRELLRQTRRLYHETGRSTPVIHPRYGNLTTSVTEDDAAEDHSFFVSSGTFHPLFLPVLSGWIMARSRWQKSTAAGF